MSVTIYTGNNTKGSGSRTKPLVCVPYIDETTGTWWTYDTETKQYVDTGVQAQGPAGEDGADGAQGVPGIKGDPGTSVYVTDVSESAVDGGSNIVTFSDGTVLTVKNGNRGERGPAGRDGQDGLAGAPGNDGEKGDKGDKGDPGTSVTVIGVSESGADGGANIITFSDGTTMAVLNGNTGSQGPAGAVGPQGPQGLTGSNGAGGPPARIDSITQNDNDGEASIVTFEYWDQQGDYYIPQTKDLYVYNGNKGNTGARGPQGIQGPQGDAYEITEADYEEIAAIAKEDLIVATVAETKTYLGIS